MYSGISIIILRFLTHTSSFIINNYNNFSTFN